MVKNVLIDLNGTFYKFLTTKKIKMFREDFYEFRQHLNFEGLYKNKMRHITQFVFYFLFDFEQ